jgi:hypothetical protein
MGVRIGIGLHGCMVVIRCGVLVLFGCLVLQLLTCIVMLSGA